MKDIVFDVICGIAFWKAFAAPAALLLQSSGIPFIQGATETILTIVFVAIIAEVIDFSGITTRITSNK